MSRFIPLSSDLHQGKGWLKPADHSYIAGQSAIPLVAEELPHALSTMPTGFRQQQDGSYELVAVCSLDEQRNLFVHPDGRWIGSYRPASVRAYPFQLLHNQEQKQYVLGIDEDSGLMLDNVGDQGHPFFDEQGQPAEQLGQLIKFLTKYEQQRRTTQNAVNMLSSLGLIMPWKINMATTQEGAPLQALEGLYRIDEQALRELPVDRLDALRQVSAFPIIYGQLFSQHRLDVLIRLYGLHKNWTQQDPSKVDLESLFDSGDDSISFEFDD
ncbi:SapC family protein [Vreelandella titanicae]|uniref:SapC family protein n=1 Tax=Vreelandella titanicae TaxID=664683 RepID=UPI00114392AA|nr:SapC family protein [Halomonas titanicae]